MGADVPFTIVFVLANTMKHKSRKDPNDKGPIVAKVNF